MEIRVKVELSTSSDESPMRIWLKGNKLEIIEIEDRWYSEDIWYYKIFTDNARHYILKKIANEPSWTIRELGNS